MSLNIQERDLVTGELKRTIVAGNSNIVDTAIKTDSTWSSKKINDSLVDKQDFRIFNSLEEFNEKKGTSLTVVSGVDNMKDIVNAMSNGEILIIITKCELGSEVYFGLTTSTGWTKMFTFVKSNGLCDVECRTTFPLTLKRVLNSDGVVGDWQELATTTEVAHIKRFDSVPGNDWNNAIEEGYYSIPIDMVANTIANRPFDYAIQVRVIKSDTNDSNYVYQIAYVSSQDSRIFIRKLNGDGNWTSWERLITESNLSTYYHKCIYARTNKTGSKLVKTLALEDGKCYTIEAYQGDNYRRTRVYLFSGTIRTTDEITSQTSPFTLSYNDTDTVLTITFADWSYNQCRIYEESPANVVDIG